MSTDRPNPLLPVLLAGIPVRTTPLLPEGEIHVIQTGPMYTLDLGHMVGGSHQPASPTIMIGSRPDDDPLVIARKLVREGMREVLAWLDHPPTYLTGREVLDKLAGHPVWNPRDPT